MYQTSKVFCRICNFKLRIEKVFSIVSSILEILLQGRPRMLSASVNKNNIRYTTSHINDTVFS